MPERGLPSQSPYLKWSARRLEREAASGNAEAAAFLAAFRRQQADAFARIATAIRATQAATWTLSEPASLLFAARGTEDEQRAAAELVADAVQWIGRKRWVAHAREVQRALAREAERAGTTPKAARRDVYARAVRIVALEARRSQPRIRGGDDEPYYVDTVPLDVPLIHFRNWATTRVADEVMGSLVPEWRAQEREGRRGVEIVPLDDDVAEEEAPPRRLSERTRQLLRALDAEPAMDVLLARLVYRDGLTSAEAGRRVGVSAVAARVRLTRLRQRLDRLM